MSSPTVLLAAPTDRHPPVQLETERSQEIDPASSERRPSVWPLLAVVAAGLLLLIALPLLAIARPTTVAYCAECAIRQETRSWRLRGTEFTLRTRSEETPTLVSAALVQKRLVGNHAHHWLAPRVVPNPLSAYAPPVTLSLGFLDTPLVAGFLINLGDWADPESAQNTRQLILRPEYSYLVNHSLRFLRFPPRGFSDRRQFQDWLTQHGFGLYSHLREETEPD